MAILIAMQGPETGRKFAVDGPSAVLGRQFESTICLQGKQVSRHHAQILAREDGYVVEDLGSSNGTFVNGKRLAPNTPVPLTVRDTLQVGPYVFALRPTPNLASTEPSLVVREQVVTSLSQSLYAQDPAGKLHVVLEIAQTLARTLDLDPLLDKLLEHLMRLFPQADRAMALLCEEDRLFVRGQRCRRPEDATSYPYSRTIVNKALDDGVGILSEDARADQRFRSSDTLSGLELHSLLCVPLIGQDGQRLGVIQVDRFRRGVPFKVEDLHLLTAISLQVAVVLELASLHAQKLREERLRQELAFARDIQQGFLPSELEGFPQANFEIVGRVFPCAAGSRRPLRFPGRPPHPYPSPLRGEGITRIPSPFRGQGTTTIPSPPGGERGRGEGGARLAFFIGDVSGKGMPAALFMVAVRTLCRHLANSADSPAAALARLNQALAADNPSGMFVTLTHGLYDPATSELLLASGGHPLPLLRHADGKVEEVPVPNGRLLGFDDGDLHLRDMRLTLGLGQTLVFYTDGVTEAREPEHKAMFGIDRFKDVVRGFDNSLTLETCADNTRAAVETFSQSKELQDDVTVLLLRRRSQTRA